MSDLQATFEFSIELYKFYNVDLFQRGLYQIRVGLRVSPKVPVQIEVSVTNPNQSRGGRVISGASLINGLGASKPFQILYRNEEVTLRDTIQFRAHLLVDSRNLKDSLERAEWSLGIELWCGDSAGTLAPAACRVLKLHFQPAQGLHYNLPVLFDYFHLAAVTITIHACLVALHQPYINTPRSSKQWGKLVRGAGGGGISMSSGNSATLESVLFGSSGVKCSGSSSRIAHARQVHAEVCGILLGSLEGLESALSICGSAGTALTPEASSNSIVGDVAQRIKNFSDSSKKNILKGPGLDEEEEFACGAAHDIARLCAEVTLRWRSFLRVAADRPHVHHALAARHHVLRIKRFSECFFVLDNPRHSLAGCYDSNYQSYQSVGEAVRRSRYLALLPPLPVHCIALDGDSHIMPIIFEDRYQDTAEFARRRSVVTNGNKSDSDPFLCGDSLADDCPCSINSVVESHRPSSAASRISQSTSIMDVLEPKLNSYNKNVLKATLTLTPKPNIDSSPKRTTSIKKTPALKDIKSKQCPDANEVTGHSRFVVQNNQINEIEMVNPNRFISGNIARNKILSRFSASTLIDIENHVFDKKTQQRNRSVQHAPPHFISNGINSLPTRHSKSLDQLRMSNIYTNKVLRQALPQTLAHNTLQSLNFHSLYIPQKPTTLPRNMANVANSINKYNSQNPRCVPSFPPNTGYNTIESRSSVKRTEEYHRNINEFREKYKNPCGANINPNFNSAIMTSAEYGKTSELQSNANQYRYAYNIEQGNRLLSNFVRNPLELQRGLNLCLPHPVLPPRNSYPPVSGKHQHSSSDYTANMTKNQIYRSSSAHVFPQKTDNRVIHYDPASGELLVDSNQYFLGKAQWSYNYSSQKNVSRVLDAVNKQKDKGLVLKIDKKKSHRSSKTPPPSTHPTKHKKIKSKEQRKLHQSARELSKLNSSKDSLSSRHSSKSRESSDRNTPKSSRATPTSEKRSRHKASERMSQQISEASTSSTESIPIALRRLETSASVPYRLGHGIDNLRHCRSAASVLDEPSLTGNVFSESLPNLAPPPAFDSPLLDITDENFKILPPDTFKNEYLDMNRASVSTSSLSDQSGWVSSGKSSETSTPEMSPSKKNVNPNSEPELNCIVASSAVGEFKQTVLNGEQLREKLMKLAVKVAKDKENSSREKVDCDQCNGCQCDSICTNTLCDYNSESNGDPYDQCDDCCNEIIENDHAHNYSRSSADSFNFSPAVPSKTLPNIVNGLNSNITVKKSITDSFHPYIRKEIPIPVQLPLKVPQTGNASTIKKATLKDRIEYTDKLLAAEIRSLTMDRVLRDHSNISCNDKSSVPIRRTSKVDKCKSEINLSHFSLDTDAEEFKLPPPQQFRDIPPPPDEFKDPPPSKHSVTKRSLSRTSSKSKALTPTNSTTPTKSRNPEPLQLDNPLYHVCEGVRERRKSRIPHTVTTNGNSIPPAMSKSQSTGELAAREEGTDPKEKCEKSLVSVFGLAESERLFIKCRDEFRHSVKYPGSLYSDFPPVEASLPYFHISDEYRMFNPEGLHLVICVHGLDGNSADLRLVKTYLELGMPGAHLEFLMSERNQGDTFSDFDTMTERLVDEITQHIKTLRVEPARISFVGHSLGTIIIRSALARPQIKPLLARLHTFLSLSGPHLGTLYNSSGLVNAGMWFMQKWKRSGSLLQLSLRDAPEPRRSFLYRLSERSQLHRFKYVLLCGSGQDRYVPLHSARLELCKAAAKDASPLGQAYREMVHNLVSPLASGSSSSAIVVRYEVQHALPHTASALVGRAAHIAALDSDLFIEKFLLVSALKYFR